MNNQFSPMSEDNTPTPHQRFFGQAGDNNNLPPEGTAPVVDDFTTSPLPEEVPAPDVAAAIADKPEVATPDTAATASPAEPKKRDAYYNETKDHLLHVRKQRNAIILQMDKLEDERIEKGSDEYDTTANELGKLQNDLWRKNNLIDALVKVLISLG